MLSKLSPDPTVQGATQKVSAIRHFLALDRFYKIKNRPCNTRDSRDRHDFAKLVGESCSVCIGYYTTNFYHPLKDHDGDYGVGSNFYSAGQISKSLENTAENYIYPKRGNIPLLTIQNGVLIQNIDYYPNFNNYVQNDGEKVALILWLLRKEKFEVETITIDLLKQAICNNFTQNMVELLLPSDLSFEAQLSKYPLDTQESIFDVSTKDIDNLFKDEISKLENKDMKSGLQSIYFGCPGCGKSYKVKTDLLLDVSEDRIFRTTFHPDTDYSSFVGAYKPAMNGQNIEYRFVPQVFTNAYVKAWSNPSESVYLVIEEINRGNCAQIFGDLFQLLDRKNGISEYPIAADADLKVYLKDALGEDNEGIANGKLKLPANLNIIATMNTSDQSLFPMDSAFKRRWNWHYVPINYSEKIDSGNFVISIGVHKPEYKWVDFLKKVNKHIFDLTSSEDKQMGNFFIKSNIGIDEFRDKVMFYLWNEVCKDVYKVGSFFKEDNGDEFSFTELYGDKGVEKILNFMKFLDVSFKSESSEDSTTEPENATATE